MAWRRHVRWLGVIVFLGVVAAGCSSGASPSPSSPGVPTTGPTTRPTTGSTHLAVPSAPGFKSLLVGLLDKGAEAPYHLGQAYPPVDLSDMPSGLVGVVVNATWDQLEPRQGTFDFSVLDASFAAITAYDHAHPESPLGARLRVFAAFAAPQWAKELGGPAISVPVKAGTTSTPTLGRWWETPYRQAWASLQQALAKRYDGQPVLHDVAVSSCATLTAEPFVIAPGTMKAAGAAGWTPSAEQACLDGALSDYAVWRHTAIYYPMNPFPGDPAITTEVMGRCARSQRGGGPWCILGNNALSPDSATTGRVAPVYEEINGLWSADATRTPVSFQMNGPQPSTYCDAMVVAVEHHAQSVELWPRTGPVAGGFAALPLFDPAGLGRGAPDRATTHVHGLTLRNRHHPYVFVWHCRATDAGGPGEQAESPSHRLEIRFRLRVAGARVSRGFSLLWARSLSDHKYLTTARCSFRYVSSGGLSESIPS